MDLYELCYDSLRKSHDDGSVLFLPCRPRMAICWMVRQVEEGDTITYLNIYRSFVGRRRCRQWCERMFVRYKAMLRVEEIRSQVSTLRQGAGCTVQLLGNGRPRDCFRCPLSHPNLVRF